MEKEFHDNLLRGCRVLVVEDDFLIADDFTRRLSQAGAQVLGPAATLDLAHTLYSSSPAPHVAVLDINLRGTLVFPFAERLQRDGVPFLFCTGYGDDPIVEPFRAIPRLEKPLSQKSFAMMLSEIARLHGIRSSSAARNVKDLPM